MDLSIDFGGTTYSFVIFNQNQIYYKSESIDIKQFKNYYELFNQISLQVYSVTEKVNILGIGCPGPLDASTGLILNTPNLKILQYVNIKNEIVKYIKCNKVKLENDANSFVLGAYYLNKNIKSDVVLGITLGTGIGFGIIINGKLFTGSYGMAGEYELSPLENGETWADKIGYKFFENISKKIFNKNLTPKELFDLAENKNEDAINIWKKYGENIGICLSHVINLINPNYIFIGGGVSKGRKYFHNNILETLKDKCFIYDNKKINFIYDVNNLNVYYGNIITIE